jgi:hypothetical protein
MEVHLHFFLTSALEAVNSQLYAPVVLMPRTELLVPMVSPRASLGAADRTEKNRTFLAAARRHSNRDAFVIHRNIKEVHFIL